MSDWSPHKCIAIWWDYHWDARELISLTYSACGAPTACHSTLIRMQRYSEGGKVQYVESGESRDRRAAAERSDSAAKTSRVNVIGSLHHMSQWSRALMRCRWIRIIRPRQLKGMDSCVTAAVFRGANIWRRRCFTSSANLTSRLLPSFSTCSQSDSQLDFHSQQFTNELLRLDGLSECECEARRWGEVSRVAHN